MLFDLPSLYTSAFGYVAVPYFKFGMPTVDSNVDSLRENYSGNAGLIVNKVVWQVACTIDGYTLPNEPLIQIDGPKKNLVKTGIDGTDGTFKELFGNDDYNIVIKGIAIQDDGSDEYPYDIISAIDRLATKKQRLEIWNKIANNYGTNGIQNLVIENVEYPAIEGAQSWQPYILHCVSDFDFSLKVKIKS